MRVVSASYQILTPISVGGIDEMNRIEQIARVCYKSEDRIREGSSEKFIQMLIDRGHEAMIEHSMLSVLFTVDRGVSHEMVRHRIASFAQESTRYCNYSKEKFGNELTFIFPSFFNDYEDIPNQIRRTIWERAMQDAEKDYFQLLKNGATPQEARTVLPMSLKTDITITANYREWRNILRLRTAGNAHPQMKEVMRPLAEELNEKLPVIFPEYYPYCFKEDN